jgi:pimeloyl-ACP methyl ester carboxylesterase
MRARQPDQIGYAVNDGVRIYYEACGDGDPAVLFVPGSQQMHSRSWKMQVAFLARRFRTVVYDSRGSGRSDHPATDYGKEALAGDALAVVAHLGIDRFAMVAISGGARPAVVVAARHPARVAGLIIIGGSIHPGASITATEPPERRRARMRADFDGYVRDFWTTIFPEPHSTKPREDGQEYTLLTDPQTLIATVDSGWAIFDARPDAVGVQCPVLLIHGTQDGRVPYAHVEELRRLLPQAQAVTVEGAGHFPMARDPVWTNLLVRDFLERATTARKRA